MKKKTTKGKDSRIIGITAEIKPKFRVFGGWKRKDIEKNGIVLEKVQINSEKDSNKVSSTVSTPGRDLDYPLRMRDKHQHGFHEQRISGKDYDWTVAFIKSKYPKEYKRMKIRFIWLRKGDILFMLKNYNRGAFKMTVEEVNGKKLIKEEYQFDWFKGKLGTLVINDCPIYKKPGSVTVCSR